MTDFADRPLPRTPDVGPTVAREMVRVRLKELREAKGLSTAAVAGYTGWSISKLTRIEKGDVTVQPLEVRALLSLYDVDDADDVAELARLSQASRTRQWYSRHRLDPSFQRFVGYEYEASVINSWQLLFVPGLLQTEEYAHEITALSMRLSPDHPEVAQRVQLRMDRQIWFRERLTKPNPPRIRAVIDEAVLRRPVGGRDTLRRQLDHLLELGAQPERYELGVTPLDLVHHSGLGGVFELLQFARDEHPDVLFVEAAAGIDRLTSEAETTTLFRGIVDDLFRYGRTGDDALALIRSVRDSLAAP